MKKIFRVLFDFFVGVFGDKYIRYPYNLGWMLFWMTVLLFVTLRYIMFPLIEACQPLVHNLNKLIWG